MPIAARLRGGGDRRGGARIVQEAGQTAGEAVAATAGGQCPRPVSLIDLYPTLVDLCGLPSDTKKNEQGRPLDGHSLKPLLTDPENGYRIRDLAEGLIPDGHQWVRMLDPRGGNARVLEAGDGGVVHAPLRPGKLNPHDLINMGHLYLCKGKKKEAVDFYRQSITSLELTKEEFMTVFAEDKPLLISLGVNPDDLPILLDYLLFIIDQP